MFTSKGSIYRYVHRTFRATALRLLLLDDAFVKPLAVMSTNNIDSNNCEEEAALCGVADVSKQADEVCASCGIAEVDNVKLKKCTCELVKYCSEECQEDHRSKHKRACKKRLAELREELLFRQPESSHLGDCPICFLPHSINVEVGKYTKSEIHSCCSKRTCDGCEYANAMREHEMMLERKCPFCRTPMPGKRRGEGEEEAHMLVMKRAEANDPVALRLMGEKCLDEGDCKKAFEYWTKAAELGDMEAHYNLSCLYRDGHGVKKDEEKMIRHLEEAAIGGHPYARFNLGCYEERNGRFDRAVKHFIIAANLGDTGLTEALWDHYKLGSITKEDLEATLRTHQAAIDATKSPQRDAAAAARRE